MKKEFVKGGLGDNRPDSMFDKKQLEIGIKVEMEHTKDRRIAKEIAKDHLVEFKDYYKELNKMEKKLEDKKKRNGLIGNYKGYDYEIDDYGYEYKIYLPAGKFEEFKPYYGNRVLEIGDTKERIKLTRSRIYSRINTLIKRGY